jgi:3-isopropylmalate/(R)-2-methylmalate dehydratase small subunit
MELQGRSRRFGANVSTDDVIAGKYKHSSIDPDELVEHLMENVRPGFRAELRPGDFIVAGPNFGCGSSREQAPQIIRHAGVSAVVAPSFARIFFRNAINIGLLLLICDTSAIHEDDQLVFSTQARTLAVPERGLELHPVPLPDDVMAIVEAGGLLAHVRARGTL